MNLNLNGIAQENNFSEIEKNFAENSAGFNQAGINQSRVISELVLGKKLEKITEKIITSNAQQSRKMATLTLALVFVGIVQVFAILLPIYYEQKSNGIKKQCSKIAPSTIEGNTEKNYSACLRSHGLEK